MLDAGADHRCHLAAVRGGTLAGAVLLVHRIGWSVQFPARRAAERDEARIAAWRQEVWPVVKEPRRTWAPG